MLGFFMDSDNPAQVSKYSQQFVFFKYGCSEDWIKCLIFDVLP
jgi:hypothetical protein